MLIVFCGPPGVGKSTIARPVAARLRAAYLRIDTIEQALVQGFNGLDPGPVGYGVAHRVAADQLALAHDVVVDAVHPVPASRQPWIDLADETGHRCLWVETVCSDASVHRQRLLRRNLTALESAALSAQADRYEPLSLEALVLDSATQAIEQAVDAVLAYTRSRLSLGYHRAGPYMPRP